MGQIASAEHRSLMARWLEYHQQQANPEPKVGPDGQATGPVRPPLQFKALDSLTPSGNIGKGLQP